MSDELPYEDNRVANFVEAVSMMPDHRDNRGKKNLIPAVIIAGFVLATLVGRSNVSGIHRFIRNRISWLREVTGYENADLISRAHLPRLLNRLDWDTLNNLIEQHFGICIERDENKEWVAIDGKVLRGTVKGGDKQSVVLSVTHDSRNGYSAGPTDRKQIQ